MTDPHPPQRRLPSPHRRLFRTLALACALVPMAAVRAEVRHEAVRVEAPFVMPAIQVPVFPGRDFKITDHGAEPGGKVDCGEAIRSAIAACSEAGGGRVVVPEGSWHTGKVHLLSNVNLHLEEGAELVFSDDPEDYLPAVHTSWEGMECFNYSPLIYAFGCENVAITGPGKLRAEMGTWKQWFSRPPAHMEALKKLYHMMSKGVPVEERRMAEGENNLRPQFIQFNRCRNVLVEDVRIRESPFWTIHLLLCDSVVVRGIDVWAKGHNNDGIDPEMTRNLLIEDCLFDQGDDAVAIKSGRNHDGWRLETPTENVVIRNCVVRDGHQLVAIGTELSGGVRNVYVHDCEFENRKGSKPDHILFIKTNRRRGGFVENIHVENIKAERVKYALFGIETDVLYQWKNIVPTYEERITGIRGIYVKDISVGEADMPFRIHGDERKPVEKVVLENLRIDKARHAEGESEHVRGLSERKVRVIQLAGGTD